MWSPDGTRMAWDTRRLGNLDIYVMDVDDKPNNAVQKNLTKDSKKDDVHPRFSPDGTKILFESKRDGDWEIFVMDSRTGENIVQLTNNEKNDKNAEWSRKGAKIAFESKRDGNSEIYVIDADGANLVNISNDLGDGRFGEWRGLAAGQFASKKLAVEPLTKHLTTLGRIKQTALLQNYPNPFNPETWMPYILAEDSSVTIRIYTASGQLVRTLALGHKKQGAYLFRTQAAYWDGNNDEGEAVGSGVYFYQLHAGDFSTTRKMVVAK